MPTDIRLGRLVDYEIWNAKRVWPMQRHLATLPAGPLPTRVIWPHGPVRDQGQTPQCVGYTGWDWEDTGANRVNFPTTDNEDGPTLYAEAQALDGIPLPHDGSTVRALGQALQNRKQISAFLWASVPNDFLTWLLLKGPVMLGTNWYDSMFTPDANGHLTIGGSVAGGHAYEVFGVDTSLGLAYCLQHWGAGWQPKVLCQTVGEFTLSIPDVVRLIFAEAGECAGALEPTAPPPPPAPPAPPAPTPAVDPRVRQAASLVRQADTLLHVSEPGPVVRPPSPALVTQAAAEVRQADVLLTAVLAGH